MTSLNPKITVVTPTYYRPDLLKRAILSVQAQTFEDYEHIIVSDHCPHAAKVYEEFKSDSRIVFIENPHPHVPNVGAVGKNLAVERARSNFICYCDDDNVYLPNHLEVMYSELSKGQSPVIYTKYYHVTLGKGDGIIKMLCEKSLNDFSGYDHIGNTDNLNMGHTTSVLEECGGWKRDSPGQRDGEDTELMKRFEKFYESKIKRLDEITCIYYARAACIIDDVQYKNELANMENNQVYVYDNSHLDA